MVLKVLNSSLNHELPPKNSLDISKLKANIPSRTLIQNKMPIKLSVLRLNHALILVKTVTLPLDTAAMVISLYRSVNLL